MSSVIIIALIYLLLMTIFRSVNICFNSYKLYKAYGYKEISCIKLLPIFKNEYLKKYDKAISKLYKIIENTNKELELCYIHMGSLFENMGNLYGASENFEKALEINHYNKELIYKIDRVNYNIASTLIYEGKAQEALDFLLKVSHHEEGRSTSSTLNNISWAYNEIKDYEHSLEYSNYGLEKEEDDYYLLTNKGNALFGLERNEEALEAYNKAIELAPENYPFGWYGRGITNYCLGNYEEGEKAFKKYLEIKEEKDGYYYLLKCLHEQSKFDEKIEVIDHLIESRCDLPWSYNIKGDTLCFLNKFHKAIECFDKAIELEPEYADAYYNKCRIFCDFNVIDGALSMLKKAVEFDRRYIEVASEDELLNKIRVYREYYDIVDLK